jgi:hypothetical protein
LNVTLPPLQTITAETPGTSASLKQGWAYMDRAIGDVIGGIAVFRQRTSGRPDMEAVVPLVSQFDARFVLLYDNANGFATAFALANPREFAVNVTMQVRDEDGTLLSTLSKRFAPYEHMATNLLEYVPGTRGKRGLVEFTCDNDFGVAVLGLRFNPTGAFTSFHVLSNIDW